MHEVSNLAQLVQTEENRDCQGLREEENGSWCSPGVVSVLRVSLKSAVQPRACS